MSFLKGCPRGMLLSSAGRVNARNRREDLSHAWVNSVPQAWFCQLPTGLSVKVCLCHREGLPGLAGSRRTAGRELTVEEVAKDEG